VIPTAKLIVTLRDPVSRTYSDYLFFGRLQATELHTLGNNAEDAVKMAHIRTLTPANFDLAMKKEVEGLEKCFTRRSISGTRLADTTTAAAATVTTGGRNSRLLRQKYKRQLLSPLLWNPPASAAKECDDIRREQLEMLPFYSERPPGRLLVSLYPLHLASWVAAFPCDQLMVTWASGVWSEKTLREIAVFLGVDPESAREAAARSNLITPESDIKFNAAAFKLAEKAGMGPKTQQPPMLDATKSLLEDFFDRHWEARFPPPHSQTEPCASFSS
jgi:hypothetical protein